MPLQFPYVREELEAQPIEVLDRMAFGVTSGEVVNLQPAQIRIRYPGDLENAEHRWSQGGLAWARQVDLSEPVQVRVNEAGEYELEDGHHRWLAAGKTGRTLRAEVDVRGNPIRVLLARTTPVQATARKRRTPRPAP